MPGSDLTQWDALLKEDYAPKIINALNDENFMQAMMTTEFVDDSWQGRVKVVPTKVGRNWSIASIGAGGALPQAGRSSYVDARIGIRDIYGRVGFERYVIEQSRNKRGSWAQVIPQEMDGLVEDLAFRRNAIAWGYGNGILALLASTQNIAAGVALELKDPGNVAGTINANRYIFGDTISGMTVAVIDATTQAVKAFGTVIAVNADGTDITLDVAVNALAGDFVVVAASATNNSYGKEPEGMLAGIDDGTYVNVYHAINRTTYPIFKSYVVTGVGALSLDALQQPIDAVSIKVGTKGLDMFACEHAVRRAYLALLETDRRYTGADLMSPDGGTAAAKKPAGPARGGKAITYGDIPVFADRDCPYGMFFGINKASWIRYVEVEGKWAEEGGSVIKWVPGFDAYTAFWLTLENYHCQQPARNFRLEGITVNQLIVRSF